MLGINCTLIRYKYYTNINLSNFHFDSIMGKNERNSRMLEVFFCFYIFLKIIKSMYTLFDIFTLW